VDWTDIITTSVPVIATAGLGAGGIYAQKANAEFGWKEQRKLAQEGRKPVKAIYRREEVFKGKHADAAPDILMEPAEGYSLTHAKSALEDADWVSGDHRPEGVIVAAGPKVTAFEQQPPMLIDLAPTILAALDAPASIRHTGRVLHEVVGAEATVRAAEGAPAMGAREEEPSVTDTEADEMGEHLRGLGYLQ